MAAALVINTELQPGAYRAKGFQPFQRLVRCTCSLSRSNGLAARFACVTGLKAGVNHIDEFECCSVRCPQRKTALKSGTQKSRCR